MKKVLTLAMAFSVIISTLLIYAPPVKAETPPGSSEKGILTAQWSYNLAPRYEWGYFGSSPAIADLGPGVNSKGQEPNSDLEIVVGSDGCYFHSPELGKVVDGLWRCFDSRRNWEWATDTLSDEARSSPVIVDLNGDGCLEIVAGTTSGETLEVMDRFGNFIWTFPSPPRSGSFYYPGSPAVADLDPAVGGLEIVIGNRAFGTVLCLDGDNSDGIDEGISAAGIPGAPYAGVEGVDWDLLWIFYAGGQIWASPAIGDVDNDGTLDVVIGSTNGNLYILNGKNGTMETSIPVGDAIYPSAALTNLDSDAYLEMVVGAGNVYCFEWTGSVWNREWTFCTVGAVYSSAAVGDVDGDGSLEIVVGSADGEVYCISSTVVVDSFATAEWSYQTEGPVYSSPALAYRGIKGSEYIQGIYIGSDDGYLYLLDGGTGSMLDRFRAYGPIRTSPAVADIDGDTRLEVVFYDWSSNDTLWCLEDTQSSVRKYAIEWSMFRQNPRRTAEQRVEKAIAWALDWADGSPYPPSPAGRYTKKSYIGLCLAFVTNAYQYGAYEDRRDLDKKYPRSPVSIYGSAYDAWQALKPLNQGLPPRGVYVFYDVLKGKYAKDDHVALSLGEGKIVHSWTNGPEVAEYDQIISANIDYLGWAWPPFVQN